MNALGFVLTLVVGLPLVAALIAMAVFNVNRREWERRTALMALATDPRRSRQIDALYEDLKATVREKGLR